jgi:hypothetical protein
MAYHYPEPQDAVKTVITRLPATQLLTLNSADRFQNSSTGLTNAVVQPWNKFILQRPQNLMEAFAIRISVSEVRFPWFVPNINSYNNTIWLYAESSLAGNPLTVYPLVVPSGFYTLKAVVAQLNALIGATNALNPPTFSVVGSQIVASPGVGSGAQFSFYWFNPSTNATAPSQQTFFTQASLAQTLGFDYEQVSGGTNITQPLIGNPTELLYTQYVDIVSEKLNYFSKTKDGSSSSSTNKALICRLYVADEVSIPGQTEPGQTPFVIHRQFSTPKDIMWNKEAVIDYLDISVIDQFGQLVPLPVLSGVQSQSQTPVGSYPNFQITLLASEN